MRLTTISYKDREQVAIVTEEGLVLIDTINKVMKRTWNTTLYGLLQQGEFVELKDWYGHESYMISIPFT